MSATRTRYYADRNDVLALTIETDLLTSPWQFDRVGDTEFPHVYGPINLDAIVHTGAAQTRV